MDTGFTLKVVRNGKEKEVLFQELLDRPTIVSVYMRNNTPGCDRQNRSLAADPDWFDSRGYNLVALSKDGCRSHLRYAGRLGIRYQLASDPEYRFAKATGSIVEKKMFGITYKAPSRSAFVIGTDGTILGIIEKLDTKNHLAELKELIGQLRQGEE